MTNVVITDGNISFSIQLIDICSDTLEGEKDVVNRNHAVADSTRPIHF